MEGTVPLSETRLQNVKERKQRNGKLFIFAANLQYEEP